MKVKKDRLFILVMTIVVAGLVYQTLLWAMDLTVNIVNKRDWLMLLVNGFAIYGALMLIRNNRRKIKLLQKELNEQEKQRERERADELQ